jgi:hypothetical protein
MLQDLLLSVVSVDGGNGQRGALVHLPQASPETITEVTPRGQCHCHDGHTSTCSPFNAVLNQGDQGGNLIPPSLILIPDIPDIPDTSIPDIGVPWVPSGA